MEEKKTGREGRGGGRLMEGKTEMDGGKGKVRYPTAARFRYRYGRKGRELGTVTPVPIPIKT